MSITLIDQKIEKTYRTLLCEMEVISIHSEVINLCNSYGNMSLVSEKVPLAPRQMRCEILPSQPSEKIIKHLIAKSFPTTFDCTLHLPQSELNEKGLEIAWQILQQASSPLPHNPFIQQIYQRLWQEIENLLTVLENARSISALKSAVKNLIGLGMGLTPSGDDFLAGFLISLRLCDSPFRQWLAPIQTQINQYLSHTHSISAAFITDASQGQVNQYIQQCIDVLYSKENPEVQLNELVSLGHSSGYDLLSGLLAGLPHLTTRRTLLCPYIAN